MLRRLMGLVLIISILMPIILAVAGFFLVRQIVSDVENVARGPLRDIRTDLDAMKTTLDEASRAFQGLSSQIASIGSSLTGIGNTIAGLTTRLGPLDILDFNIRIPVINRTIRISLPDIPAFNVPGLTELKNILSNAFDVFNDLVAVLGKIGSIGSLPSQLNGAVARMRGLVDDIGEVGSRWLGTLTFVAVVLLVWVIATYIALVYRWLSSGWRMLQGLPAG